MLTKLGIASAIIIVLFASANIVAERVAEDLVADGVAREFDLSRRPDVDLTGFPVLFRALGGNLPDVRFTAERIVAGDLQIAELSVQMTGIEGTGSLFSGPYSIEVRDGVASVVVDDEGINALLAARDRDATVRINEGGVRVRTTIEYRGRRQVSAAARVRLDGRRFVVTPVRGSITIDGKPAPSSLEARARKAATLDVELPTLPGGIEPTEVVLAPGRMTVNASLGGRTIEVRR
jgi:hypothetical protein